MYIETIYMTGQVLEVQIRWTGGATFRVYEECSENDWNETDAFSCYSASHPGSAPDANEALAAVESHFAMMMTPEY